MPRELEKEMPWDKLCIHVLGKIGGKLKKNEIPIFKRWFMDRECLGYLFDYILILRCFKIWQELKDGLDHFIIICGREGFGKSTLSFQIAAWVNPQGFNLKNVCYGAKDYLDILGRKAEENLAFDDIKSESLVLDEGTELLSKEAMNATNRTLTKTFFVQRALKFLVIVNIPNFHMLDVVMRHHRVRTLIEVTRRGKYKCITGKGINIVAKEGSTSKQVNNIRLPSGYFWNGYFSVKFPKTMDRKEYEDFKSQSIRDLIDSMKDNVVQKKMVSVGTLAKEITMKPDTIIKMIKSQQVEGKQIGNKWYITRKAYDKLITP